MSRAYKHEPSVGFYSWKLTIFPSARVDEGTKSLYKIKFLLKFGGSLSPPAPLVLQLHMISIYIWIFEKACKTHLGVCMHIIHAKFCGILLPNEISNKKKKTNEIFIKETNWWTLYVLKYMLILKIILISYTTNVFDVINTIYIPFRICMWLWTF